MKKEKIILLKCQKYIAKYRNKQSIYYNELIDAYNKYQEQNFKDNNVKDLYLKRLNDICNMIELEHKSPISLLALSFLLISIIVFASVSTYNFFISKDKLDSNIEKANTDAKIVVNYQDMDEFNPFIVSNDLTYEDLKPIKLNIDIKGEKSKDSIINYKVYLVLENDNEFDINKLSYNIKSETKVQNIKKIEDSDRIDGKILLFSNDIKCNSVENIELRMWLTEKQDNINKNFKFKLYVDGSVI